MLISSFGNFFKKDAKILTNNIQNLHYAIRGKGLSYNDCAIYENVKFAENTTFLMDLENNLVRVSAGKTLEEINRTLNSYGYELPVTPGTMLITAGGAFASNIHGKSHHVYGAFADQVYEVKYRKNDGSVEIAVENSESFNLLAGSFGLMYEIIELTLKVKKMKSNALSVTHTKCNSIEELMVLMKNSNEPYTVAWFDSSFYLGSNGRGLFMSASELDSNVPKKVKKEIKIPKIPSFILQSNFVMSSMNKIYFNMQKSKKFISEKRAYLYPLDSMLNWDNAFGVDGMFQFQCVIEESVFDDFLVKFKEIMIKNRMVSFVSVLKKFGDVTKRSPLDFPISRGYTIAMDFSAKELNIIGCKELISLVNDFKGKVYLAKDSFLNKVDFSKQYGNAGLMYLIKSIDENQTKGLTSDMLKRLTK